MSNNIYQRSKNFLRNSKKIHKNRYDYSKVDYVNAKTPVIIGCPIHGYFKQTPEKHTLRKHGCPVCGGTSKSNTSEFIEKANNIHDNKYEYMLVNYTGNRGKVQIVCREHGVFEQTPKDHLDGCGCPKCGGSAPLTQRDFLIRSMEVHGNKYDYSLAKYVTDSTKVIIICPSHGEFKQAPMSHMRGAGCPICNKPGHFSEKLFNENEELKSRPGKIYLLEFTDINENIKFLKVGITQTSIEDRFRRGYKAYKYNVLIEKTLDLYDAFLLEQHLIRTFVNSQFIPPMPFGGRNECFTTQYKDQIIKTILTS